MHAFAENYNIVPRPFPPVPTLPVSLPIPHKVQLQSRNMLRQKTIHGWQYTIIVSNAMKRFKLVVNVDKCLFVFFYRGFHERLGISSDNLVGCCSFWKGSVKVNAA